MTFLKIILLAVIQGLAELLPVSSSAHVVVAEKLMGMDPSSPQMTLLLVMLHTGTMFAVIVYFWKTWKSTYFSSSTAFKQFAIRLIWASVLTVAVGEALKIAIEKTFFRGAQKAEIELLFSRLDLIWPALAAAGVLILIAGILEKRNHVELAPRTSTDRGALTFPRAGWMGVVQGLALPFRGFSRSGSTISTGILTGAAKEPAERFSFAMAVVLTPPLVLMEVMRLRHATQSTGLAQPHANFDMSVGMSLLGAVFSFIAGLVALRWLSSWLEAGRWYYFGIYCLVAAAVVFFLHTQGF